MTRRERENEVIIQALFGHLLGEKLPFEIESCETGEIIIPVGRKITATLIRKLAEASRAGLRLRYVAP